MRWVWSWLSVVVVVVVVVWSGAPAIAQPADERALDARARDELANVSKAAVEMWDLGTIERSRGRLGAAEDAYGLAADFAVDVEPAHRRLCEVAMLLDHFDRAVKACRRALELRPELPHNKAALAEAIAKRDQAQELAREQWLANVPVNGSYETPQPGSTAGDAAPHAPIWRIAWIAGIVLGSWLAGMLILLGLGYWLSRATLRAVNDLGGVAGGGRRERRMREQRLRRLYRIVLTVCGVYFYLSLPLVLLVVIAAGAGTLLGFIAIGYIPVKGVVLVGAVVIITIGAIGRSLFLRVHDEPPGDPLPLVDHPKLRALLVDVATTIGTRPADRVYLTPGTDMAVTERLGLWRSVRRGRTERSLIMGIGLFDGMTQLQLRSILAHEHGHFRNQDTAGGGFALQVRRSLVAMIFQLAQSGAAGWINPAWWFLRGYFRIYLGVSQGASRLQEVLADRWAIQAYGSAAFVAGYRHVVARSVEFDVRTRAAIGAAIQHELPLTNLYATQVELAAEARDAIATEIATQLTREPDSYDSHPSSQQRIEWAEAMAIARESAPDDDDPVWALFADRDAIERSMTGEVRERIRVNHRIELAAGAKPAS